MEPGQPLFDPEDAGEPEAASLPTERVSVHVDETLFGEPPAELVLFKTGSENTSLEGDPAYKPGERYLLLLAEYTGEAGLFVPPAPDARMRVEGGLVEPVIEGPIADLLGGNHEAEVERLITQEVAAP